MRIILLGPPGAGIKDIIVRNIAPARVILDNILFK